MANQKLTQKPIADALTGDEVVYGVQDGTTVQVPVTAIVALVEPPVQPDWNATEGPSAILNKPATAGVEVHSHYQSESHGLPDTDTSATSIHHTLGTGANQAASGTHDHTGVYEPADLTILKDADIGVSVSAPHSHPYASALGSDENYVTDAEKLALHEHSNRGDLDLVSGTNTGDQDLTHDHNGVYEPADSTILKDADIGVTVSAPHSHPYAAALGADDNYITDAEKTKLTDLSGTNTGDQDLSGYSLTGHNHDADYLSNVRGDFWAQGGLYVGIDEPPGGLVSYADWVQYGVGYFGYLNIAGNAPMGSEMATITPTYASGNINPILAAYERNITAIVGTASGDGSTFALQASVSVNGNVWAAVGVASGAGSVQALAATFVGSASATVGIAYGDGSVNNLTATIPVAGFNADFSNETGDNAGWTNANFTISGGSLNYFVNSDTFLNESTATKAVQIDLGQTITVTADVTVQAWGFGESTALHLIVDGTERGTALSAQVAGGTITWVSTLASGLHNVALFVSGSEANDGEPYSTQHQVNVLSIAVT